MADKLERKKSFVSISDIIKEEKMDNREGALNLSRRPRNISDFWGENARDAINPMLTSHMKHMGPKPFSTADSGYGSASPSPDCLVGTRRNPNASPLGQPHPMLSERHSPNLTSSAPSSFPAINPNLRAQMNCQFLMSWQGKSAAKRNDVQSSPRSDHSSKDYRKTTMKGLSANPANFGDITPSIAAGLYNPLIAPGTFSPYTSYFHQLATWPYVFYGEQYRLMMSFLQNCNIPRNDEIPMKGFPKTPLAQESATTLHPKKTYPPQLGFHSDFTPPFSNTYQREISTFDNKSTSDTR